MTDHDTELAREITEKGLEEYSSSWKKANKKGDAGRPFRECMSEAITQALRSVRKEENEAILKLAHDHQCPNCGDNLAISIRNRMKENI